MSLDLNSAAADNLESVFRLFRFLKALSPLTAVRIFCAVKSDAFNLALGKSRNEAVCQIASNINSQKSVFNLKGILLELESLTNI